MRNGSIFSAVVLLSVFLLSGCVVRTYKVTRDRVDQNLTGGNRGYIMGNAPQNAVEPERKTKRSTHVVEIELRSPVKFEKAAEPGQAIQEKPSVIPESISETKATESQTLEPKVTEPAISKETPAAQESFQKYTVQKGDTLQKISEKFFGTTKKWTKIFDANREALKGPNKIYPGQVINIPVYPGQQPGTKENLK